MPVRYRIARSLLGVFGGMGTGAVVGAWHEWRTTPTFLTWAVLSIVALVPAVAVIVFGWV